MNWDQLLSAHRLGSSNSRANEKDYARSQFQRDYDRIIFSSPFRRLQNKTQVFPLPGSIFVHNRLTHSMEVASIGRSLANLITQSLIKRDEIKNKELLYELGSIVSAACLAHDMGNPPFGHSGEDAISTYFKDKAPHTLKEQLDAATWQDLIHFEGNANAFRILTHQFNGRRKGGFALTFSTLAAGVKYPYGSEAIQKKPKYGYFHTEKEPFIEIAQSLGLPQTSSDPLRFARHPLVYLVEAADDIAYQVMDIEDAHKLKILSTEKTQSLLLAFFDPQKEADFFSTKERVFKEVTDTNEQMAYLRASVINLLVNNCATAFMKHYDLIMTGQFNGNLTDHLTGQCATAMDTCKKLSKEHIYNHRSVVEIELAGFHVLGTLLDEFVKALIDTKATYNRTLLDLIPKQFYCSEMPLQEQVRGVVDYVSGMTDLYALDLFKKMKGISLSAI